MKLSDFRQIIKNELQYGEKKVAYMCSVEGNIDGGMCFSESEAFSKCKDFLNKIKLNNNDYEFNVIVYGGEVRLFDTYDVLNKIKEEL